MDKNNLIGIDSKLPWKLQDELEHFKKITTNSIVIMGRKTFESIIERNNKLLPNRITIVVTKNRNYHMEFKNKFGNPTLTGMNEINGINSCSNLNNKINFENNFFIIHSIDEAIMVARKIKKNTNLYQIYQNIFCIGGYEIYKKILPIVSNMYISYIKNTIESTKYTKSKKIFFPTLNYNNWNIKSTKEFDNFTFRIYSKKNEKK